MSTSPARRNCEVIIALLYCDWPSHIPDIASYVGLSKMFYCHQTSFYGVGDRGLGTTLPTFVMLYCLKVYPFPCSLAESQSSVQEKTAQSKALEVYMINQVSMIGMLFGL